MSLSNFNLYNEPAIFENIVFLLNILVYGGLVFSALHIIRLALFDKAKLILSNITIILISTLAVCLNIYFHIYLGIWGFAALYLLAAWISWKWIDRKSLRWTNVSIAIFFLFTLGMYILFNAKLQTITYSFFSFNDIVQYSFEFKPYFGIVLPGKELSTTKILIDNEWLLRGTDPVHYRLYVFYYSMQLCAIVFWLIIFFDVLKKHMFFYKKQAKKLKEYMFYYAPEDFKWISFKEKCPREIFLEQKKQEKKKLKSGEFVKVVIPKSQNKRINNNDTKNTEESNVDGNQIETDNKNSVDNDISIDKSVGITTLLRQTDTGIKYSANNGKEKAKGMDVENMKNKLLQQAKDLQQKAQELLNMANSMGGESSNKSPEVETALNKIANLHNDLVSNPVFSSIKNIKQLRKFMEWHVFAVWDFMSLTKRLQIDLTCVTLPWLPPANNGAANLINSIVWGEETDKTPVKGQTASHFELYLKAMEEIQADTTQINRFINLVKNGTDYKDALREVNAPSAVVDFTTNTIETALHGSTQEVLGSFFYGRENVIPEMFDSLLKTWDIDKGKAPTFVFYLERHIELDSGDHGPAAQKMIDNLCPTHKQKMEVYLAAQKAVLARIKLWDSLNMEMKKIS